MLKRKLLLKFIVLGDCGVGKTSLLNQFVNNAFNNQYKATIGADFFAKELKINEKDITLQIWDTAGLERFQSLGMAFYRGVDCCILVYDITRKETFDNLNGWVEDFVLQSSITNIDTFPFVLIGNKVDVDIKTVTKKDAQKWSQDHNDALFFETSAKEDINVTNALYSAARLTLSKDKKISLDKPENIILPELTEKVDDNKKQKTCC